MHAGCTYPGYSLTTQPVQSASDDNGGLLHFSELYKKKKSLILAHPKYEWVSLITNAMLGHLKDSKSMIRIEECPSITHCFRHQHPWSHGLQLARRRYLRAPWARSLVQHYEASHSLTLVYRLPPCRLLTPQNFHSASNVNQLNTHTHTPIRKFHVERRQNTRFAGWYQNHHSVASV